MKIDTYENDTAASNEQLIVSIAAGDDRAFSELHDRISPYVMGWVVQTLRDRSQSEEVAQEVLLEMWQQSSRFDGSRASVLRWAKTLAHGKAVDRVRSSQASRDRDAWVGKLDLTHEFDEVVEAMLERDQRDQVRAALRSISTVQREAVSLCYFSDMTRVEIAYTLEISLSTLKTRLRDGLIQLRRQLEPAMAIDGRAAL